MVTFNNKKFGLVEHNGQYWMTCPQIVDALGVKNRTMVSNIYVRHKSEFEGMTCLPKVGMPRLFNREGAWLIGMFARTPKAAEFRKWVLKVLGAVADNKTKAVVVTEHTRSLPTGKKEIVLSEKAKTEIGGIVKSCLGSYQSSKSTQEISRLVGAMVTVTNYISKYEDLMREVSELNYQAKQREKQARSFMEVAERLERELAS